MKVTIIVSVVATVLLSLTTAAAQEDQPDVKMIKGGVLNGKAVELAKPQYPEALKTTGAGGVAAVTVTIDENGHVISAESDIYDQRTKNEAEPAMLDPLFRSAAEEAALRSRFSPTRLSGQPVKVTGTLIYNFNGGTGSGSGSMAERDAEVLNERAVSLPKPEYPAAAKAVKAGGAVTVAVVIDEAGNVIEAVAAGGHPLLRGAATAAARQARFEPQSKAGAAVKISGLLIYNFVP